MWTAYSENEVYMRYLLLKPRDATFDPRHVTIRDHAHLHALVPPVAEADGEKQAHDLVRSMEPHALALPFPLKIGSGHTVMLGLLDPSIEIDEDDEIPFTLLVQPITQDANDRRGIAASIAGTYNIWDKGLWKLRPIKPDIGAIVPIEWRTSELDAPAYLQARVGFDLGRLVIFAEMGEHAMSIRLPDGYRIVHEPTFKPVKSAFGHLAPVDDNALDRLSPTPRDPDEA